VARVGEDVAREGDDPYADLVRRGLQPDGQRARGTAGRRRRRRRHGGGGGRVLELEGGVRGSRESVNVSSVSFQKLGPVRLAGWLFPQELNFCRTSKQLGLSLPYFALSLRMHPSPLPPR
jgi:hypothetical protein